MLVVTTTTVTTTFTPLPSVTLVVLWRPLFLFLLLCASPCLFVPTPVSCLYVHPVYHHTIGTDNATKVTEVMPEFRLNSPKFRQGNESFNVTAPLISWYQADTHTQFDSCTLPNSDRQRVQGKLLFISLPEVQCFRETFIEHCQKLMCAGIVMASDSEPAGRLTWSQFEGGVDRSALRSPLVEIR